jgi:hypothetical protein
MTSDNAFPKGLEFTVLANQLSVEWTLQSDTLTVVCNYRRGTGKGRKILALFVAVIALVAEFFIAGPSALLRTSRIIWEELQKIP